MAIAPSAARRWSEALRHSFWVPPAGAMAFALAAAVLLPEVDAALGVDLGLFSFGDTDSARALLELLATAMLSVAGIVFSVTVVALQLASQQLGPRVMRTFQGDRLNQATLATFLGAALYALVLLTQLPSEGRQLPQLSLGFAVVVAVLAFGLLVRFIHHIVVSLQASTVIDRIRSEAVELAPARFPAAAPGRPDDPRAAARSLERSLEGRRTHAVVAEAPGFLRSIDVSAVLATAAEADLVVRQRVPLGEYAVRGGVLAEVAGDASDEQVRAVRDAFRLGRERTSEADVEFPIRQLADIALRALSPSLNDPTTAQTAMEAMTDVLIAVAREGEPPRVLCDEDGVVRFAAAPPSLADLVETGFAQVRRSAHEHPEVERRLDALERLIPRDVSATTTS